MAVLVLTVTTVPGEDADVETLLCGLGKLLSQENKILGYKINRPHLLPKRIRARGPYSPEEQ